MVEVVVDSAEGVQLDGFEGGEHEEEGTASCHLVGDAPPGPQALVHGGHDEDVDAKGKIDRLEGHGIGTEVEALGVDVGTRRADLAGCLYAAR